MRLEVQDGQIVVDAAQLAPLLGLSPDEMRHQMQGGQITTMTEQGQGDDQGRFRVTFTSDRWRLRLTCTQDGTVLTRVRTPVTTR